MSSVFSANSSSVTVNGTAVTGVQSIDYRQVREHSDVFGLGSHERIAIIHGASHVDVQIRITSADPTLDGFATTGEAFQVVAQLTHGETSRSVAFDECFMETKEFALGNGGAGQSVYRFTATRVREED